MIRPTFSDSFGVVSQLIGAKWKELDPTAKDEWRERAKKLNASREDEDEDEMLDGELDDALDGEMDDDELDDDDDELSIPKMLEGAKKRKARKESIGAGV